MSAGHKGRGYDGGGPGASVSAVLGGLLLVCGALAAQQEPVPDDAVNEIIGSVREATPLDSPWAIQARALRGLRTGVVSEMFSGQEGGELTLSVLALPLPGEPGSSVVPLFVEVDGAGFLERNEVELARVEVYVYAFNEAREIGDYLAEVFAADVERVGENIWQSGFEFFGHLELPPGVWDVRVLVRNFQSRASALKVLRLEVPDFGEGSALALTPLIEEPQGRDVWLPVRSWQMVDENAATAFPLLRWGQRLNPSTRPVLVAGRKAHMLVPVAGVGSGGVEGSLVLGRSEPGGFAGVAESTPTPAGRGEIVAGLEMLAVEALVPDVEAGAYRAIVRLATADGDTVRSWPIDVIVAGPDTRERNLLWSDMRWILSGRQPPPRVEAVEEKPLRGRKKRKQEARAAEERRRAQAALEGRYRDVLTLLLTNQDAALGQLFEYESEAIGGAIELGLEGVHRAELNVATRLAKQRREYVIPLLLMHEQMYERYRNRRLFTLLHHTRSLLEELADLFVDVGGGPKIGARMLASLGGYLQESNLSGGSRRLFERALYWDFNCAPALMGLASGLEKTGNYRAAIDHLEQLVTLRPDYHEAALRLALNLERVGLERRAQELLEGVIEDGASGWVGGVASQELGRILIEAGDVERAAEMLESAVERLPAETATLFLLAHAYDRLGSTSTALERLAQIRPQRRSRRSERWIYDRWPQALLDEAREDLARKSEAVSEELLGALTGSGGATE